MRAFVTSVVLVLLVTSPAVPARADTLTWTYVVAGEGGTSCAIRSDGTLWCWGVNWRATIGPGGADTGRPVRIGDSRAWASVASAYTHTCATRTDGTLWCWGENADGELGIGASTTTREHPVQVGAGTTWRSVDVAGQTTCAVRADGSLWCWGGYWSGDVTDAAAIRRRTPQRVGADADWTAVTVDGGGACGLRAPGSLWCWENASDDPEVGPPLRVGTSSSWAVVSAKDGRTCGVDRDAALWCWGANRDGQVGDGTDTDRTGPVRIGAGTSWASVSAGDPSAANGGAHTCALSTGGATWCWGDNAEGKLGDGTTVGSPVPVRVNADLTWRAISAGGVHTCGLTTDGRVWCWGDNMRHELGDGGSAPSSVSVTPRPVGEDRNWADVSAGESHTCARRTDATAWCWGGNTHGQLGDGTTAGRAVPRQVRGGGAWRSVVVGTNATCGVRDDGGLWCWGLLPRGATVTVPQRVGDVVTWTGVTVGEGHLCAVRDDGTLWCWGRNAGEVLGNRVTTTPRTPVRSRREIATTWAEVAAGDGHTCGRDTGGRVWCWGFDGSGQRGDAPGADRNDPIGLTGVASIHVKGDRSCALGTDRRLRCWGDGIETPQLVTGDRDWRHVAVGSLAACGIRAGASLWCWGVNARGQVGDGTVENRRQPVRIGTDSWLSLGGGYQHMCGVRTDHGLWCWGDNRSLQLGSVIPARRAVPVPAG
ncbi:hypothetical protein [Actinoplanes sp. CA-252034]|uniref:RCC1 domain-containing protein n=1 Tax=Actinoplanes sp. CA-252034 TaxID=3239906 RepID=UPI003D99681E